MSIEIEVCTQCGSANVMRDAWVHANNPSDVRTFDATWCENCEGECSTTVVTVADGFDVTGGFVSLAGC